MYGRADVHFRCLVAFAVLLLEALDPEVIRGISQEATSTCFQLGLHVPSYSHHKHWDLIIT